MPKGIYINIEDLEEIFKDVPDTKIIPLKEKGYNVLKIHIKNGDVLSILISSHTLSAVMREGIKKKLRDRISEEIETIKTRIEILTQMLSRL